MLISLVIRITCERHRVHARFEARCPALRVRHRPKINTGNARARLASKSRESVQTQRAKLLRRTSLYLMVLFFTSNGAFGPYNALTQRWNRRLPSLWVATRLRVREGKATLTADEDLLAHGFPEVRHPCPPLTPGRVVSC